MPAETIIPYYRDSEQRVELGDTVLVHGHRLGTVNGVRLDLNGIIRVAVDLDNSGFVTCGLGELEHHEIANEHDLVRLPANIAARFDTGEETDADVVALVDAYRRSRTFPDVEIDGDPMHSFNGALR